MENNLFSDRSILTMLHGVVLGGGVLMGLAAALFFLRASPVPGDVGAATDFSAAAQHQSRQLTWLLVATAALLWLTVIAGTYVIFGPYRATPPAGATDLSYYPKSLIQSNPSTAWLHSFAMEIKEHVPWIAAMIASAVAFVSARYKSVLLTDRKLRTMSFTSLAICFVLVSFAGVLGVLINKVGPLE